MKMDTRKLAGNKRPLEDNIAAPASKRKNENESTIFRPKGKLEKVKDLLPLGMNISRKALRKEMRQIKKARRHAHYTRQAVSCSALSFVTILSFLRFDVSVSFLLATFIEIRCRRYKAS